jgi:hypothetical protein
MTVPVSASSRPGSPGQVGEIRTRAPRTDRLTGDVAAAAPMTDFEEFVAALRAWADQVTSARTALAANPGDAPIPKVAIRP